MINSESSRIQRRGYLVRDLPIISMVSLGAGVVSILVLALYLNSQITQLRYTSPEILWGICGVLLYWIIRVVLLTNRGEMHEDPVLFAIKDRISRVCFLLVIGFGIGAASL